MEIAELMKNDILKHTNICNSTVSYIYNLRNPSISSITAFVLVAMMLILTSAKLNAYSTINTTGSHLSTSTSTSTSSISSGGNSWTENWLSSS